jgi:periplasmic protein TonB
VSAEAPLLKPSCGLSRRGWSAAGLAALVVHACAAGFALALGPEEADAALGAPATEVSIELAAPKAEASDLPPGPEAEDSAASPALQEQRAEVEKTDAPKATPTEAEDPDRVVSPDAPEKPSEEPLKSTVTTQASTESAASEAAAPQAIENAPEAPRQTAPAQGSGDSAQRVRAAWQRELVAHLNRNKRYPAGQARRNEAITLSFALDRLGRVVSVAVIKSSGDRAFDEAAVAMVRRSDPVPQPPPRVADEGLTFTLPVLFRAKGRG